MNIYYRYWRYLVLWKIQIIESCQCQTITVILQFPYINLLIRLMRCHSPISYYVYRLHNDIQNTITTVSYSFLEEGCMIQNSGKGSTLLPGLTGRMVSTSIMRLCIFFNLPFHEGYFNRIRKIKKGQK